MYGVGSGGQQNWGPFFASKKKICTTQSCVSSAPFGFPFTYQIDIRIIDKDECIYDVHKLYYSSSQKCFSFLCVLSFFLLMKNFLWLLYFNFVYAITALVICCVNILESCSIFHIHKILQLCNLKYYDMVCNIKRGASFATTSFHIPFGFPF